jgi:uncharacterized membrane protein YeiH
MFASYFIVTALSLPVVILLRSQLVRREKMLLVFDAIGLAMFTVIGIEKSLAAGTTIYIAIAMGLITGAFGGVMRDILINEEPLIFRKDIYAMACLLGGVVYWVAMSLGFPQEVCAINCSVAIVGVRMCALRFGWHLPTLRPEK